MYDVIYVLTDSLNEKLNRYIVDVHSGNITKLRDIYIDALPTLIIRCFIKTNSAQKIYDQFNDLNHRKIVTNADGDPTEWIVMPWIEIFNCLCILNCHDKTKTIDSTVFLDFNECETDKIKIKVTSEELDQIFLGRRLNSQLINT